MDLDKTPLTTLTEDVERTDRRAGCLIIGLIVLLFWAAVLYLLSGWLL